MAGKAGIEGSVHVHQLRHSFARILADEKGSLTAVWEALGHRNPATTRVYVESIRVKPDRHSQAAVERLGLYVDRIRENPMRYLEELVG